MDIENHLFIIGIILIVHLLICLSYSKEIYYWVPTLKNKFYMLTMLWLVPIIGAIFIHRHKRFKHMRGYKEGSADEGNAISSGMLEIDSVFNPGARNFIEAVQQQKVTRNEKAKKNKNVKIPDFENIAPNKINKGKTLKD